MAALTSVVCSYPVVRAAVAAPAKKTSKVSSTPCFGNFSGLRTTSSLAPVLKEKRSVEEEFAVIASANRSTGKGGALSSRCDIAAEIFAVVPIMSALVLVGIALGFVLLRVEAAVEESSE
eukprot:TRINITY_DN4_c0_g1_i2.p1 TRINITY_DN4_c0_g1~~TRINITY_DN4_c0_g1_i2.p1  ORF type:complete len:120 (-),score=23.69 TRINITY_DN4_c0_g1_i2:73-432(-)